VKTRALASILAAGALGLFVLINRSYEKTVLAPMLGSQAAAALSLCALVGAVLMGALLLVGLRKS
jgi:hypothetical protein